MGKKGMSRVIGLRLSLSCVSRGLPRRDIGLLEDGSVEDLDGFSVQITVSTFS